MAAVLPPDFDPEAPAAYEGIFGLPTPPEDAAAVLLPVPWDVTTSHRRGAARGPWTILASSSEIDLHDLETGRPYERGIALLEADRAILRFHEEALRAREEGHLDLVGNLCNRLHTVVEEETRRWRRAGKVVGVVGGDHSVSFGAIRAVAAEAPGLGILQVDAHADLRRGYEGLEHSHASIMANVLDRIDGIARVVQVGLRDVSPGEVAWIEEDPRLVAFYDHQLPAARWEDVIDALPETVWVSFDVDGLDPALCPHTGTPVPGGLSWREAMALLAALGRSGRRILGFDVVEVAPGPDASPEGESWDGNVGSRLVYKLCGWALRSAGAGAATGS